MFFNLLTEFYGVSMICLGRIKTVSCVLVILFNRMPQGVDRLHSIVCSFFTFLCRVVGLFYPTIFYFFIELEGIFHFFILKLESNKCYRTL